MLPNGIATALAALASASLALAAETPVEPGPGLQQAGTEARHEAKVAAARAGNHSLILIGGAEIAALETAPYREVWDRFLDARHPLDLGYEGSRTANLLWNLRHGELDGQSPKAIALLTGGDDTAEAGRTPEEVAAGVATIVQVLREKCPEAKVLLLRALPRTEAAADEAAGARAAVDLRAGELVAKLADEEKVFFLDVNHVFFKLDGSLDPLLLPASQRPTPAGAMEVAREMEPVLAPLLGEAPKEPLSANTAVVPVSKLEKDGYDWWERHRAILKLADDLKPEIVLIGDSITHFWDGAPQSDQMKPRGPLSFEQTFSGKRVINLGYGWDRTQNVLWRLDHSELDGIHAQWVVINIGSNNFAGTPNARVNSPAEIADGIREIVLRVRAKSPGSKIVITGVFPFGRDPDASKREPVNELNKLLADSYREVPGIRFIDVNSELLQPDGSLSAEIMPDGVHPAEKGYKIWGDALAKAMQ
ncbi:GDSL-type esterase/lipase family protein [Luteolibacter sp. LG18]|uniref:GDSL-type esterase/lipase family protein n=1 Tax=Luteolibacter sp. LG18 TaxID=2819286 RepID=UPI002B2966E3|nr:acetylhydrolase [Luteolibacter sp. LG18]